MTLGHEASQLLSWFPKNFDDCVVEEAFVAISEEGSGVCFTRKLSCRRAAVYLLIGQYTITYFNRDSNLIGVSESLAGGILCVLCFIVSLDLRLSQWKLRFTCASRAER